MLIEPLSRRHDRAAFDCGNAALNDFLKNTARHYADRDTGMTFVVAEDEGSPVVLGFITLAAEMGGLGPEQHSAADPADCTAAFNPHGFVGMALSAWRGCRMTFITSAL